MRLLERTSTPGIWRYAWRCLSQSSRSVPGVRRNAMLGDDRVVATRRYLQYILMPLWFVGGVADYICHRRSKIETTSGMTESVIHSLMLAEAGISVLAALHAEIDPTVIELSLAGFVAHQATMIWDVAYAVKSRLVSQSEQHFHSMLEVLPFCTLSILICLHWAEFRQLLRLESERTPRRLKWHRSSVPRNYSLPMTLTTSILGLLYSEELWRCIAAHKGFAGVDNPPAARELYGSPSSDMSHLAIP